MIEETAVVVDVKGKMARVEPERKSTCGSCSANSACGTSLLSKFLGQKRTQLVVKNAIGAKPGERVVLGLPDSSLPRASFLLYILPLLSMLLSAFTGEWLMKVNDWMTLMEPVAIVCGLLGLLVGLKGVKVYTQRFNSDQNYQAVMLRKEHQSTVDFVAP